MIKILDTKDKLAKYQAILKDILYKRLPKSVRITIGHQGESFDLLAQTNGHIWYVSQIIKGDDYRNWNAFGLEPQENRSNNILVEINIPVRGKNRRIGGAFGIDRITNKVLLLHRGKVGGGRPGIGKEAFFEWVEATYPQRIKTVQDGDRHTKMIFVADLDPDQLLLSLLDFIRLTAAFKQQAVGKEIA